MNKKYKLHNNIQFINIFVIILNNIVCDYYFDFNDLQSLYSSCRIENTKKLINNINLNYVSDKIMMAVNKFINITNINFKCDMEYSYLFYINNLTKLKKIKFYYHLTNYINFDNIKFDTVDMIFLQNHPDIENIFIHETSCIENINSKLICPKLKTFNIKKGLNNNINFSNSFPELYFISFKFNLSDNSFFDFTNCPILNILDLENCLINDLDKIKGLEKLNNLKILHLNSNHIDCIDRLKNLKNVTYLDLSENFITNLKPIENLDIKLLDINNNELLIDITPVQNFINLTTLDISNCNLTDIQILKNCKDLNYLKCEYNSITNISVLNYLNDLIEVSFYCNKLNSIVYLKDYNFDNIIDFDLRLNLVFDIDSFIIANKINLKYNKPIIKL